MQSVRAKCRKQIKELESKKQAVKTRYLAKEIDYNEFLSIKKDCNHKTDQLQKEIQLAKKGS